MFTIFFRKRVCRPRHGLRNWPGYHLDCSTKDSHSLSREQEIWFTKRIQLQFYEVQRKKANKYLEGDWSECLAGEL
jgi:hypothetical protein